MIHLSNVLLIHISGRIGDSLLATPSITTFQKNFLNARIDLLVHRNRLDLFKNVPNVNLIGSISEKRAWYKGWLSLQKYDYVIIFNYGNELRNIIKFALRVGKKVIASPVTDHKINARLFASVPRLKGQHHINVYLNYIKPLHIKKIFTRIAIFPTLEEYNFAKSLIAQHNLSRNKFIVGYQICSFPTKSYRDWPLDNFIALSKKIREVRPNAFFIVFGSKEDRYKSSIFIEHISIEHCLDLSGLSLRKTAAVMSLLNLYVGVDTGPTHMMSAFNVPMVSLYHGKFPSQYYSPIGHPHSIVIDHPKQDKCSENDSMADISVDNVFSKLKKFLKK